jgi:hypothetical protein
VFYVSATNFTSTGSDCGTTCKYLEAAPANWLAGTTGDPPRSWATDTDPGAGIGNQDALVTTGTAIGSGYQNSLRIVAQAGNAAASSAAVLAREYGGGSKSDWFLPSKAELNELYVNKAAIGGFSADSYWSSSEFSANFAWYQYFGDYSPDYSSKNGTAYVRPVRAFGGTLT